MKIVYVMGWGRSGSTLLDTMLGEIDGFFSAGELRYVFNHFVKKRPCGCGRPIDECPVWRPVMHRVMERVELDNDLRKAAAWQREALRLRHLPRLLQLRKAIPGGALAHYVSTLKATYEEIAEVTGNTVVIDSSKRPSDGAVLRLLPDVEVYLIHLVRDPRAVAYSWQRKRPQGDRDSDMQRFGTLVSSSNWLTWNVMAEVVCLRHGVERCRRIRYEDLVADPRRVLQDMAVLTGTEGVELPTLDDFRVTLLENHTVAGNPRRFQKGTTTIRNDEEWLHRQSLRDRVVATAVSSPLLRRYGYKLRPTVSAERSA
ncbi:MAG: sulfotransferase [Actinomycetota bacterium]|nr:sulfotransferase [Actinomycetota bacterium]